MKRVLERIINPVVWLRYGKKFPRVRSAGEFASILNRERDRTDRTGQEFSLVVFETGDGSPGSAALLNLVPILAKRTHSTDDIGWLEDGRIAVSLPHTLSHGAWKFVVNVRRALDGAPVPDCTVYVYPSQWISRGDGTTSPSPTTQAPPEPKPETQTCSRSMEELDSNFLYPLPAWKRAIDVVGSLVAMILLSPLILLVSLFIMVVSPGPIFFRQERLGYLGRRFTLWKFRTMHVNADTSVHQKHLRELIASGKELIKLDDGKDQRIIPFGSILRTTGIDELPQLVNVLLGEMSLVGPRPCLPYEVERLLPWQMRRFDAVPGLTGLWQVSGKNRMTFREMMALDIRYAKRTALPRDVKIVLKTVPAIARQVSDRPFFDGVRAKGISFVLQVGMVALAVLTLYMLHN